MVVLGTQKKGLVLLPAGQTWFEWAEGQRVREELRSLELKTIAGHALSPEEVERQAALALEFEASQRARAAAAGRAVWAAEAAASRYGGGWMTRLLLCWSLLCCYASNARGASNARVALLPPTLCSMLYALCSMRYALCSMLYALCSRLVACNPLVSSDGIL